MDIARQRGLELDVADVRLFVQDGLVQVGDAPALGNTELEQLGQFLRRFAGGRISPGSERNEELSLFVERKIAVHHGGKADGADGLEWNFVLGLNVTAELAKALLQSCPDVFEMVCPDTVFVPVLPLVASRGDWRMIRGDQDRLDSRRAEFDAQRGLASLNGLLGVNWIHASLPCF